MTFASALVALVALGCAERNAPAPAETGRRTAAVKPRPRAQKAQAGFCEKTWPATGAGARRFTRPPERPLPGAAAVAPIPATAGRWTWYNLWATWCVPCIEEMGLLARWRAALEKEGRPIHIELLSIDADDATDALKTRIDKGLPGEVRWLRGDADLGPFMAHLDLAAHTPIPVHALVDARGMLRCVRVGAIHSQDYALVKSMLTD